MKNVTPISVVIENVSPALEAGRYPVKREVGDTLLVEADIFREGHEALAAELLYRLAGTKKWTAVAMAMGENDRWSASFLLRKNARYEYTVRAWPVHLTKVVTEYPRVLEVVVDRVRARWAAWYELFPRSQGTVEGKSGTFNDVIRRLPEIKAMGFDVLYFPPIHPIGETNRKGANNALKAQPGEPGCPWAIGNRHGGHKAIDPALGTIKDFDRLVKAAAKQGMEIALDFALQCSPDHPWAKSHPDWFYREKDGTIKFAENPPKKYEDIYPINFYSRDWKNLWKEILGVVLHWVRHGVKTFRVDNPHTKPVVFWEWLIAEVQKKHPDVIFLAEAFTRPKMMRQLAKIGFTQSYTYFTWKNTKPELTEYLSELTQSEMKEYYRGNLFANTPDILHEYLQTGGRPAFLIRGALAATLSPVYGIYSGFELCENTPKIPGKEEYLDSEKYQFKVWDWDREGNIKSFITRLNAIRRENPALQEYDNLRFYKSENDQVLFYGKQTADLENIIVCAVNLDPFNVQTTTLHMPLGEWGIEEWRTYKAEDLLSGRTLHLKGGRVWGIRLDPQVNPVAIWRISREG
jgi:starch synthase (maltosyl-transferring)